ncbi:hypothetical protein SELR_pSRC600300 (plasmid) [Selenomonas ruminantium subsp. lactilytica TAM6421]|uniref:Uncharacterized protein n=1 Tax=Selenomonas ruminantium subsp. lactilytica (strain NBRC 103574 / TAM6421) TaxID=927704 RepID=I0GVJ5_SELRL|nr:hypothetical protein [Selenomonas ruminantium]BAL84782.1 hypothetical protein SELR_pSRC600300 [Selenomonas ruminantium subsp. lactilytica TAM6421]
MRNGHYTAGDIEGLTIMPADKAKDIVQTACGRVDGVLIWSNGFDITIGELNQKKGYNRIDKIPAKYQLVAEIIRKKANGRGGRRLGAGRPKTVGIMDEKKTRSFKLTEYEYMKVKEYILDLRKK